METETVSGVSGYGGVVPSRGRWPIRMNSIGSETSFLEKDVRIENPSRCVLVWSSIALDLLG